MGREFSKLLRFLVEGISKATGGRLLSSLRRAIIVLAATLHINGKRRSPAWDIDQLFEVNIVKQIPGPIK
jgi:hypothetical protein